MRAVLPRYAIYFTPPPGSPLALFGAGVLGYDSWTGVDVAQLVLKEISSEEFAAATLAPRKYGFHATLMAPFYLKSGTENDLRDALGRFCDERTPIQLGSLQIGVLGDFVALAPPTAVPEVDELARCCVTFFDAFRAPLGSDDLARRDNGRLTGRQNENLVRWGYPYVFDDFRFHMSLTGPLPAADRERFLAALTETSHSVTSLGHDIDALSLVR
jgi:hypothetical protein